MRKSFFAIVILALPLAIQAQVEPLWVRTFDGPNSGHEYSQSIAVDPAGNCYLAGYGDSSGTQDALIVKYANDGTLLWHSFYDGPGRGADAWNKVVLDQEGNAFVTGYCKGAAGLSSVVTAKYLSDGTRAWLTVLGTGAAPSDTGNDIALDGTGNALVAGVTKTTANKDMLLVKYGPTGDTVWVRAHNGAANANDGATALVLDVVGNAYMTGYGAESGSSPDLVTVSYSSSGTRRWVSSINGPLNSGDYAFVIASGPVTSDVYIAGYVTNSLFDICTARLNHLTGDTIWTRLYDGPGRAMDLPWAITVDANETVYVAGQSEGTGGDEDAVLIKYSPTGGLSWTKRYVGSGGVSDIAFAVASDRLKDVYFTGMSNDDAGHSRVLLVKSGRRNIPTWLWTEVYTLPNYWDAIGRAVVVNDSLQMYVGGYATVNLHTDMMLVKFSQPVGVAEQPTPGSPKAESELRVLGVARNYARLMVPRAAAGLEAELLDITGRVESRALLPSRAGEWLLPTGSLAAGVHFLRLAGRPEQVRFVKAE